MADYFDSRPSVGDRVHYTASFCRSIAAHSGDIPHARGVISKTESFGSEGRVLAEVRWEPGYTHMPSKVLLSNLCRVGTVESGLR